MNEAQRVKSKRERERFQEVCFSGCRRSLRRSDLISRKIVDSSGDDPGSFAFPVAADADADADAGSPGCAAGAPAAPSAGQLLHLAGWHKISAPSGAPHHGCVIFFATGVMVNASNSLTAATARSHRARLVS